jgi:hypothetical protein
MPRKPRTRPTTCTVCGEPREPDTRHALCAKHRKEAERRNSQKWRDAHPEVLKACRDAQNAKRKKARKPRVVPAPKPPRFKQTQPRITQSRPVVVPDTPLVIGPEAFQQVKPVDIRGHKVTRLAPVGEWGR